MNDDAEIVQDDASDAPDASSESVDQNAEDQNAEDQNAGDQNAGDQNDTVEKKDVKKVRKTVQGKVVSDSMSKTLVVETERLVRHPKYHKYMRKYTKYYAHDETEQAAVGDIVELSMCRPLSKLKRWELKEIIRMAPRDNAPSPEEMARDEMAREFEGGEA
ncbi:MAG: 30S ribosomal protein S17 [Planctomycetes bacterium]|nr:30S ribosomal protein S17 [Planctomycetota bacterium]